MNGRIITEVPPQRVALPQIGKIKVGAKSDKGYPMSLDYFVASGKYAGLFNQAFGNKPQTLQVMFIDNDPEKVCNQRYEYRDTEGKLVAWGDGQVFNVWNGKNYQVYTTNEIPDLMDKVVRSKPNKVGWTVTLTLLMFVPKIKGVAGLWSFGTRGVLSTIPNIIATFDEINNNQGGVKGRLFDLNVKYATTQKPNDRSRFPVVSLVLNESEAAIDELRKCMVNNNLHYISGDTEKKLLSE